jgi:amidase
VRNGELNPQDVVQAHLDAIDRYDSRIHAYIHVNRNARSSSGMTLAVKDSQPVAGMPWTFATPSWRDRIAQQDSVPVARAKGSGMAILGKTNLPELAASIGTTNTMFPATQNPWRAGITPGGSSGGSAAAVAAGMATVAYGDDMGGSVRIPSSCCGIVGLRPTPDRIPCEIVDAAGLSSRGAMGRSVADVRYLFSVASATRPMDTRDAERRYRIGVPDMSSLGVDAACMEACRRATEALNASGHTIDEIPWEPDAVAEGYAVVRRASMASFPADTSTMGPGIRQLAEQGRSLTAMDYFHAFDSATQTANRTVAIPLQTTFDFLLTPTLGLMPMAIEKAPAFLGDEWRSYIQFVLPVSFARVAAISIPAGLHNGLPVGVQLVGQYAREYDLLDFAEELEAMPGFGFQQPPGLE